ncbi:MAG: K(+)-stimulated pyrophosphate-energized sodium pump, partial [Lentisphaeria bacterium]
MDVLWLPPILGVVGLAVAFFIYLVVVRYPAGDGLVAEIAAEIHKGAMVFMRREYSVLFIFVVALTVFLFIG